MQRKQKDFKNLENNFKSTFTHRKMLAKFSPASLSERCSNGFMTICKRRFKVVITSDLNKGSQATLNPHIHKEILFSLGQIKSKSKLGFFSKLL